MRRIQKYVAMFMVAILCLCNVQTALAEEADWDPESGKKYPVITTTKLENAIVGETKSVVLNATPMYGGEITWSIVEIPNDVEVSIDGNILRYKPLENEYTGFRWLTVKATEEGGTSCIKDFMFCAPPDENSVILPQAVLMVDNENVVRTTFYIDDETGAELNPGQAVPKNKKYHVVLGINNNDQRANKINWESIGGYEKIVSVKYPSFSENRYFLNKLVTLSDSELIFDAEGNNSTSSYTQKVRVLDNDYNPIANVKLSFHQKGGDYEYNKVAKTNNDGYTEVELKEYLDTEITSLNMSPFIVTEGDTHCAASQMWDGYGEIVLVVDYGAAEPMLNIETGYKFSTDFATQIYSTFLSGQVNVRIMNAYDECFKQTSVVNVPGESYIKYVTDNENALTSLRLAYMDRYVTLAWEDSGAILAGTSEQIMLDEQLWGNAELEMDFKGGIVTEVHYEGDTGYYYKVLWFDAESGEFVCESEPQWISESGYHSYYCPTSTEAAAVYNVAIMPQDITVAGLNWEDLQKTIGPYGNFFEEVEIQNNKGTLIETDPITFEGRENAIYITKPNSILYTEENFYTAGQDVLMEAGGRIALDKGFENLKVKGIHITVWADTLWPFDFKAIEGLRVGDDYYSATYPPTGSENELILGKTLEYVDYGEVYPKSTADITFDENTSYDTPCEFTVYFHAENTRDNMHISVTVDIGDDYPAQKIGDNTITAGGIGISAEEVVGTDYAAINVMAGGFKLVYDNGRYVMGTNDTYMQVPLYGISQYSKSVHTIKVVVADTGVSEETVVIHSPNAPTLIESALYLNGRFYTPRTRTVTYGYEFNWRLTATFANAQNLGDAGDAIGIESAKCVFVVWSIEEGKYVYIPANNERQDGDTTVFEAEYTGDIDYCSVIYLSREITDFDSEISKNSLIGDLKYKASYVLDYENEAQVIDRALTAAAQIAEDPEQARNISKNAFDQKGITTESYSTGNGDYMEPALDIIGRLKSTDLEQGRYYGSSFTRMLSREEFLKELGTGEGYIRGIVADSDKNIYYESFLYDYISEVGDVKAEINLFLDRTGSEPKYYEIVSAIVFGLKADQAGAIPLYAANPPAEYKASNLLLMDTNPTYTFKTGQSFMCPEYQFTTLGQPLDVDSAAGNFANDTLQNWSMMHDILDAFAGTKDNLLGNVAGTISIIKGFSDCYDNKVKMKKFIDKMFKICESTPCYQKLDTRVKQSLELQKKDALDAWKRALEFNDLNAILNGINTGVAMGTGGIVYGGISYVAGGVGNDINSKYIDDVYNNTKLYLDMVDMQITKYARLNNDPECFKKPNSTIYVAHYYDPAGVVYEAVLSNVIEGATVKLYTDGQNTDYIPVYENGELVNSTVSGDWFDTPLAENIDPQQNELITDKNGFYQWFVSQGLWFVTAYKDGYINGDSNLDVAATVKGEHYNWIPVLPVQLNVNIPLVCTEAPYVSKGYFEKDGVYLEFSRYLSETNLVPEMFTVKVNGKETTCTLEKLNSEQAPDNRIYEGEAPFYTSKIKLCCDIAEGASVTVKVNNEIISYANVTYGEGAQAGTEITLFEKNDSVDSMETDDTKQDNPADHNGDTDNETVKKRKTGLIIGIIIGVAVIGGVVAFVVIRRKKKQGQV